MKKYFLNFKKLTILYFIVCALLLIIPIVYAINTIDTGYKSDPGTSVTIDAHGVCQKVTNNGSNAYFVSTKTATEWQTFRTNHPADISLGSCITQTQIPQGTGTNIGNLTWYGGLAASFDSNTNQQLGYCSSGCQNCGVGYVGKDWGVGVTKVISGFKVWGSNNYGFEVLNGYNTTLTLQGSTDNFVGSVVDLGSVGPIADNPGAYGENLTSIDTSTAYRYHRIKIDSIRNYQINSAEVEFYEDI